MAAGSHTFLSLLCSPNPSSPCLTGILWQLLRLDRVGTGVDSTDREIALRVVL